MCCEEKQKYKVEGDDTRTHKFLVRLHLQSKFVIISVLCILEGDQDGCQMIKLSIQQTTYYKVPGDLQMSLFIRSELYTKTQKLVKQNFKSQQSFHGKVLKQYLSALK